MSLCGLLPLLGEYAAYQQLVAAVRRWQQRPRPWVLPGLPVAARPFLLAALQRDLDAPILVVVPRIHEARRLVEQLATWSATPETVVLYPEPDVLPYERVPGGDPSARQRMGVLARIAGLDGNTSTPPPLVVTSVRGLMHPVLSLRDLAGNSRVLRRGQRVPLAELLSAWLSLGYEPVTLVEEPGQFSRRGGIVDIYPVTSDNPVRVEFFGDEIVSLRSFDPATQRSMAPLAAVTVTPPAEILPARATQVADWLAAVDVSALTPEARRQWEADIEQLRQGASGSAGRELWQHYAPHFHALQPPGTVLDHFDGLIVTNARDELARGADAAAEQADELKSGKVERGELPKDFPPPFVSWERLQAVLARRPCLEVPSFAPPALQTAGESEMLPAPPFSAAPAYGGRLKLVLDDCLAWTQEGRRVILASHQAKRLAELLGERGVARSPVEGIATPPSGGSLTLVHGSLAEGWILSPGDSPATSSTGLVVLSDVELFGWAKPRRAAPRRRAAAEALLSDLIPGDYVVHIEHGVAIFGGLTRLTLDGAEHEYLQLDYAEGDKLYVPTDQIDRVSRYVGVGEAPPLLTRLGTADWEHVKQRVRQAVRNVARELLDLYAARQVAAGHSFSPDTAWQDDMEASFPYVETLDQLRAINEVKTDMERPQPMDRLICGDVGYGKTEVALRAAFKCVMDGKQAAILVPTTILAQQHYNTFRERLAPFPVRIEMLSRFRSARAQREVVEGLKQGTVDICIGTHRLIQKDVVFKDLGLVVIDEEQRFGVLHKEKLKKLRREVDVLTLSATPIPRTLHMSLVGARDMSTIDTPPEERLPIVTVVAAYDENLIRQAILRELDRGGQVYFVHNRVQSIGHMAHRLRNLLPDVSFAVGHGQMPEEELEQVMLDFAAGKTDVLICTAIIESGLDIPNVNTIIINRADQFGLAQLYQLRGRVGRGGVRAYAYMLHDRSYQLSSTAEQRLKAIFEASELGAGFRIAMKDLEIRGAGNILGVEQHGNIAAVGFDLYTRLLAEEVERLKEGADSAPAPSDEPREPASGPSVTLSLDAFIPPSYVEDDSTRLALYQRMAALRTVAAVEDIERELTDRFGPLPPPVRSLLYLLEIKARAYAAGVSAVTMHDHDIVLRMEKGRSFNNVALDRRFGAALKMGSATLRLERRKVGGRWREALRELLEAMAAA